MAERPPTSPRVQADVPPLDSWQRLVDAVGPASLLVIIQSRLGPALRARLEAEDILQESLLHAWRDGAAARFDSARAMRAWVLTIIDHRIRDAAEKASTLKRGGGRADVRLDAGFPGGAEPGGSTTPSRLAHYREQAAAMSEALAGVPAEWRDVVRLRVFHQLTLDQIGEQLGLSLALVRTRLRRGAEVYRQRLRAAGIGRSTANSDGTGASRAADPASQE